MFDWLLMPDCKMKSEITTPSERQENLQPLLDQYFKNFHPLNSGGVPCKSALQYIVNTLLPTTICPLRG